MNPFARTLNHRMSGFRACVKERIQRLKKRVQAILEIHQFDAVETLLERGVENRPGSLANQSLMKDNR